MDPCGRLRAASSETKLAKAKTRGEIALVPVRILVAQSQSDILAEVVADAIRNTEDFELVAGDVVPMSRVESVVLEQGAHLDVLIAVGDQPTTTLNALLATYSNILVSHIALGSDAVQLDLRKIGIEKLLSTVRVLARSGQRERGERTLAYKVVGHPTTASGGACELVVVESSDGTLISHVLAWIDAAVMLYRRKNPPDRGDLPGLARGGASVENTLRPPAPHPEIEAARRTLADAERRLMTILDSADPEREPLAALHRNLRLTQLEFQTVLLCLAPELDLKYQSVYGVLNDDLGRRTAILGLVCALLGETLDVRSALRRSGALTRWRLLESGATLPHADEPLRLEPVIVAWLLGDDQALLADVRLRHLVRRRPWAGARWMRQPADACLRESIAPALSGGADDAAWIMLAGDDADGWGAIIEGAAVEAAMPLLRLSLALGGSLLQLAVSAIQWIADQATALTNWAQQELSQVAHWITGALAKLQSFLEQMLEFFAKVGKVVIDVYGLPVLLAEKVWNWVPACIEVAARKPPPPK